METETMSPANRKLHIDRAIGEVLTHPKRLNDAERLQFQKVVTSLESLQLGVNLKNGKPLADNFFKQVRAEVNDLRNLVLTSKNQMTSVAMWHLRQRHPDRVQSLNL